MRGGDQGKVVLVLGGVGPLPCLCSVKAPSYLHNELRLCFLQVGSLLVNHQG